MSMHNQRQFEAALRRSTVAPHSDALADALNAGHSTKPMDPRDRLRLCGPVRSAPQAPSWLEWLLFS